MAGDFSQAVVSTDALVASFMAEAVQMAQSDSPTLNAAVMIEIFESLDLWCQSYWSCLCQQDM